MATPAMQVRTEGRMLFKKTGDKRLADAGKMPIDQLEALIAEVKSGKAPKVAKAADPNGAKKKVIATKAVAKVTAPVKAKKVTPAAKPVAKATEAKTLPAKAVKSKAAAQKAKVTPKPEAKPAKAAKSTPKASRTAQAIPVQGIARLDNASIDWTRESAVGTTGKRKEVLDALRKFEGDKVKTLAKLASKATEFYPGKDEQAAKKMLTWLIGRVAFDFASKSGQHVSGSRTWTFNPKNAQVAQARKKAASPARKPASPQKPAQKATRAPKKTSKSA